MIDPATKDLLHQIIRRESRSLYQYVREVPTWVGTNDRAVLAQLREMARAEERVVDALGRYLQKAKAELAVVGPYPSSFTPLNDAALKHVLPMVIREQKQALAQLESDLTRINDPQSTAYLIQLLELKKKHVPQLESLTTHPYVLV